MAVLPQYTPAINADGLTRNEIIKEYFNLGMNYVEISSFLVNVHGIHIGSRQIKRILKKLGCRRRGAKAAFHFRVFHTHVYARQTLNRLKH